MTANQKTGLRIIGGSLLVVVVVASPSIYSAVHRRNMRFRLDDPNPAVRVATVRAAGNEGDAEVLAKALQDEDADVRLVAAMQLQRLRLAAAPITKDLIAALEDEHVGVRREAAEALCAIGAPAAPALVEALEHPDPRVRIGAIRGLGDLPKDRRKRSPEELALIVPALTKLLQDDDPEVRRRAARLLEHLRQ